MEEKSKVERDGLSLETDHCQKRYLGVCSRGISTFARASDAVRIKFVSMYSDRPSSSISCRSALQKPTVNATSGSNCISLPLSSKSPKAPKACWECYVRIAVKLISSVTQLYKMPGCLRRPALVWKEILRLSWLRCTALLAIIFIFLLCSSDVRYMLPLFHRMAVHTSISEKYGLILNNSFTNLFDAYKQWDTQVGCNQFREKESTVTLINPSLQDPDVGSCESLKLKHVTIHVKRWRWVPDNIENLYSCGCGLTCMWTKSAVLADNPDAVLFETVTPPHKRCQGDPVRVYMDLEAGRKSTGYEDIFITYHAGDSVQATYAGASFHNHRSYFTSSIKRNDVLVYWSSSNCLAARLSVAKKLLSYLPHHSFGKCFRNVGGANAILSMYPECTQSYGEKSYWAYHLHCAMSHYKFVLAIENTMTESYVTEKLFYALDAGAVPIYFGAANVWDLVPPNSIIDASKFKTLESLALHVKKVAADPVLYAGYHAWRRCGVVGNYGKTRSVSLDSLPCRLCAMISKSGGKNAPAL